ncbi:MAG TPA: insulinase family protein, partial [Terriglobia bacterium]|nr:insulinase family protein [Terriglobia bacterium]
DFDTGRAKTWITKYFGGIPRGKPITKPVISPATLERETRIVFEDRVQVPRLYLAWPTIGENNDDRFALSVLAAIATGPRTTRLTKALVYDQQSASTVGARQSSNEDTGDFRITITPRPGHSLTALETATDALLEKLKAEGPTAEEIQRATAGLEFDFVSGLQSNLGKSMTLADGAGIHKNPGYFQTEYQKMLAVTAADVQRVANKYLTRGRVVLSIVPLGQPGQAAKAAESKPYRRPEQ